MVETVYNVINLVASWFAIVRFFRGFFILNAVTDGCLCCIGQFLSLLREYNGWRYWHAISHVTPQVILTSSLEDDSFGISAIRYLNAVLQVCSHPYGVN